jgi:hypothetical protein
LRPPGTTAAPLPPPAAQQQPAAAVATTTSAAASTKKSHHQQHRQQIHLSSLPLPQLFAHYQILFGHHQQANTITSAATTATTATTATNNQQQTTSNKQQHHHLNSSNTTLQQCSRISTMFMLLINKRNHPEDLQLDHSNATAMYLLDLALNLMLHHVDCCRASGDDCSYEEECCEFQVDVLYFMFCKNLIFLCNIQS